MMVKINMHDSHFTKDVKNVINRFSDRTLMKESVLDRAIDYFQAASSPEADELTESQTRHRHIQAVCLQLIRLSEGDTFADTLRKSAQFLGTIQLISPTQGKNIAVVNEQHKPIYKALLSLRLFDELILSNRLQDPYVDQYLGENKGKRYRDFQKYDPDAYQVFVEQVKVAIVMAAILQDIGNYHPDAQHILSQDGTLDPYRPLDIDERKALLQVNFRETNRYIVEGLGELNYIGNSREEKAIFVQRESERQHFLRRLLKSAVQPKNGIGNVIKVPQIYTSIILSTKANYNYKVLPKVYSVLNLNAERGACSQSVVDSLYKITGIFPQGYGVTYIPKTIDGADLDYYEYAIVSQLYPDNPEEPLCRQATRKLTFNSYGHDIVVKKVSNLYFPETAKRFSFVSKERLLDILKQLVSNYEERKEHDILPRCWFPNDYFSEKNHQKLWNRAIE